MATRLTAGLMGSVCRYPDLDRATPLTRAQCGGSRTARQTQRERLLITNWTVKGQLGYLRNKNDNCVYWELQGGRGDNFNLNLNVQFCNFSDLTW